MARMLKFLLLLGVAAASTAAASPKKNPDVERAVKSELVGKVFTTKILLGSFIPCPQSGRNDAIEMVDTEMSTDGSVRYFARANCFYPVQPGVIDLGVIFFSARGYVDPGGGIGPGTSMWVRGVDFKDDRVEIRLSTNNNDRSDGYGKIKYMLGASYRTWSAEELMEVIARGIVLPTYEKLVQLKSEFEALRASLQESESKYNASGGADQKLVNAVALREVLEQLTKNRAELARMGKSDPQSGVYSARLNTLTPEIARLTAEARQQRLAQARDQLKAQLPQLSDIQTQVRQKPPSSLAEQGRRSDLLTRYSALLDERQKLLDSLKDENEAPPPEEVKNLSDDRAEIDTARKALEQGHQQLELADLTSQYAQLTKKHAQMLDLYSRVFGTAKERTALQDLIAVLGQMITNRDRATALGDKSAAAQLVKCRAEAEKFRRK